ncbi:hypothetical protein A2U01_0022918 [Trifolium medium]|uniref:Uncharacterized protein n=1 Tax=Trifolium medium TaxID=97028 RepID=A0A392NRV6_9FABA|nr:hypothetical protein [Trifolium medium]
MELVSRVILIEQRLCSSFEWRLAFFVGEFPFLGGFRGSTPHCPFCLGHGSGPPMWPLEEIDAPVRISSTRSNSSLRASSFISSSSGHSVRRDGSLISTGITASVPYTNRNRVSPVVECGVTAQDYSVGRFGLPVSLGVLDGREVLLSVNRNEELSKFLVRELRSVVRDNS